jgi:ribosomal protein S18 acetylase RimI-like enzyme
MATYGVRLAKAGDADRLYEIHRLAMRALVERVYGPWEDAVQRPMHDEWMRTSEVQVIESEGEVVGALHVRWEGDHAYLGRIELAPTAQGQGLGTSILVDLLARAATRQLEVRLEVWEINPAVRLYRRLGFICDRTDGHKIHMSRGLAEGSGAE